MRKEKILWLSRHPMNLAQQSDLLEAVQAKFKYTPNLRPDVLEVVMLNITFPAKSSDAINLVANLAIEYGVTYIAGVFPAHIAGALARHNAQECAPYGVFVPVSVPKFAEDGEQRGFEHSHWEDL